MQGRLGGSALLSALFLMTLVAIAATAMSLRLQLDIYRTRLLLESDRLSLASQVVEFWAMAQLSQKNVVFSSSDESGVVLKFPKKLNNIYPNVSVAGRVLDLQARFNLNNIERSSFESIMYNLLTLRMGRAGSQKKVSIVYAIRNWITAYHPGLGQDQFLDYYTHQKPPYLPAYQPMVSPSELRAVVGITAKQYQALLPWITVLPKPTPLNLNTVSKPLLKILGNGLTDQQVEAIWDLRLERKVLSSTDLAVIRDKYSIPAEQISIESDYFLCISTAQNAHLSIQRYTVLHRVKDREGHIHVEVLSETFQWNVRFLFCDDSTNFELLEHR